ncbi:MAG: Prolipoprotein diacylglyceryl transferase [Bacteroidetes bacterium]|nr:Prolipoprotein diacylglyceryl transferase [Bacteroidota bacterium]
MNLLSIVWDVSPEIFKLGSLSVRWYGVLFAMAFVISYFLMKKMFEKSKVPSEYLEKLSVYMFVSVLVGARLGHCLFYEFSYYIFHPIEMLLPIKITTEGWKFIGYQGLASHGAAIGIFLGVALYGFKTKIPLMWTLDRLIIAICFSGASIRLGNLMNSEIYGFQTDLPWGFIFVRDGQTLAAHPTQLYEALSYTILGFVIYFLTMQNKKVFKQGFLFGIFLIGLFSARFFIEFLKHNQESWEDAMAINMGQWLSIPFILAGIILLFITTKKDIGKKLDIKILTTIEKKKK